MMKIVNWGSVPIASWRPGNETRLHASAATGTERLLVGEQWFEPGSGVPQHWHVDGVEEVISVVAGAAEFTLDGETDTLRAGSAVIIPSGAVHGFVAVGDERLHIWGAFSSAAPETFFVEAPDDVVVIRATESGAAVLEAETS